MGYGGRSPKTIPFDCSTTTSPTNGTGSFVTLTGLQKPARYTLSPLVQRRTRAVRQQCTPTLAYIARAVKESARSLWAAWSAETSFRQGAGCTFQISHFG